MNRALKPVKKGRPAELRWGLFGPAFFMLFFRQNHIPKHLFSKRIKKTCFLYTKMSGEIVILMMNDR